MTKLQEEDLDVAWSDAYVGMRVRWVTPTFIRRGTIKRIKGRGMEVQFDGLDRPTQIPDARWYWAEYKTGNLEEHLIAISTKAPRRPKHPALAAAVKELEKGQPKDAITPAEAANILGVDVKALRRMIRSGKVPAQRAGGRWVLSRKAVREVKR